MTLWVMEILRDGGSLASWQVAQQTMKKSDYVNVYLKRLRKYGIALKEDEFWFLTDFGEYLCTVLCRDRDRDRDRQNTNRTLIEHKQNTSRKRRLFQVSLESWLRDQNPGEAERVVVELLVKHYNETGSKYILARDHYSMAELLRINVEDVVEVLANLRQDHIVYHMRDPTSGWWKLGLIKAFVDGLQKVGS
jgi:hypothetical protein